MDLSPFLEDFELIICRSFTSKCWILDSKLYSSGDRYRWVPW